MSSRTSNINVATQSIDKGPLYIFGVILLTAYLFVAFILHDRFRDTIIQNKLEDLNYHLIYQKALRSYISKELKPVIYNLQNKNVLPHDFFEPRAQSSTYISKNIFHIYHQLLQDSKLSSWQYRLASANPLNPVNQATAKELELLEGFNSDRTLTKVERIEKINGHETLYVAIPLSANSLDCLRCHGDPEDAPEGLVNYYGTENGFYEAIGYIRGFISYRIDLDDAMLHAQSNFLTINALLLAVVVIIFSLVSWLYISEQRRKLLSHALQLETQYIAHHDFLTELNNRHSLNDRLPTLLKEQNQQPVQKSQLWAMMIDIDHFKKVNDNYGHDVGDIALKKLAEILKNSVQNYAKSKAYRLGGEEFLLILPNLTAERIQALFDKIQTTLNQAEIKGLEKAIYISAGATVYQTNEEQYDFLKRADQSLYKAKQQGRARLIIE